MKNAALLDRFSPAPPDSDEATRAALIESLTILLTHPGSGGGLARSAGVLCRNAGIHDLSLVRKSEHGPVMCLRWPMTRSRTLNAPNQPSPNSIALPIILHGRPWGTCHYQSATRHPRREIEAILATWSECAASTLERHREHEAATREKELLQAMVSQLPLLSWTAHPDGKPTATFPARVTGTSPSTGHNHGLKLHPGEQVRFQRALQSAKENGDSHLGEFRFCNPDGSIRWLQATIGPRPSNGADPTVQSILCLDVTDRREERELSALQIQLTQQWAGCSSAADAISTLTAGIRSLSGVTDAAVLQLSRADDSIHLFVQESVGIALKGLLGFQPGSPSNIGAVPPWFSRPGALSGQPLPIAELPSAADTRKPEDVRGALIVVCLRADPITPIHLAVWFEHERQIPARLRLFLGLLESELSPLLNRFETRST